MISLPRISGMVGVVLLAGALLVAADIAIEQLQAREYAGRIRIADSTATAQLHIAVIARRDARAAEARAALEKRRADSLAGAAEGHWAELALRLERAERTRAAASASIDFSTLPDELLEAIAAGDSLRLAITPALAADAAAIAGYQATIVSLERTIVLQDSAYRAQAAALVTRDDQIRALEASRQRCGRRCGVVIGIAAAITARALLSPSRP